MHGIKSVYYALDTMHLTLDTYALALDTMHLILLHLILSDLYPTYLYLSYSLNILSKARASSDASVGNATLTMDWPGPARERVVK